MEWRTHLASLGAIFLALGLGMVIGLGLGGDEAWTQRQQAALDRIEEELNASRRAQQALVARQEELARETEGWRAYAAATLPELVRGRLDQRTVGVVAGPGREPPDDLLETLRLAGARVVRLPGTTGGQPAGSDGPGGRPDPAAGVDAVVVIAGSSSVEEIASASLLLPEESPPGAFRMVILSDRFPGREVPVPDGWAAVGPMEHPAAAALVVLGLAAQRPGRYGWSSEGPKLP